MSTKSVGLLAFCVIGTMAAGGKEDSPPFRFVRDGGTERLDSTNGQFRAGLRWSHGAYFFADRVLGQPPVFYTIDRSGNLIGSARFGYSGHELFYSGSFDRMSNGSFVFAGMTETSPRIVSPFLGWTSAGGQEQHMRQTGKYLIYSLAVAPDDTIWTLGHEAETTNPDWQVDQNANVLRHFDSSGQLLNSAIPLSDFERLQGSKGFANGLLAVSSDNIGWYKCIGGRAAYIEISSKDFSVKTYPGVSARPDNFDLPIGLAIAKHGFAAVSIQHQSPARHASYILDPQSGTWAAAEVPKLGALRYAPRLIGSDSEDLVFLAGHESAFFRIQ